MVNRNSDSGIARYRAMGLVVVGMVLGYLAGTAFEAVPQVRAEVTDGPRLEAFKDGAVLNEAVLREISATLKRIESRVERIEKNTTPAAAGGTRIQTDPRRTNGS